MTQFIRPDVVSANPGGWTGTATPLYFAVNETTPNDGSWMLSPSNPADTAYIELGFTDPFTPASNQPTTVRWRAAKNSGGKSVSGYVEIVQSGANVWTGPTRSLGAFTTYNELPGAAADAINAWGAIGARFHASVSGGGSPTDATVSWVEIELPDAPPPATPSTAPTVSSPYPERLDVSWGAISGATGYDVQYSDDGGSTWLALANNYNGLSNGLNGAHADVAYTVRYRAVQGTQTSGWSPVSSPVAPDPDAPTGVGAAAGPNKATITADSNPYSAKFKVYRGLAGGTRSLVHTSALLGPGVGLSWEDTGVVNGTAYDYHVTTEVQTPTVRESAASAVLTVTPSNAVTYRPIAQADDGCAGDFAGYFNSANLLLVGNDLQDGVYRVFIKFNDLGLAQGATVPQATLRLCVNSTQNNGNDIHLFAAFVEFDSASNPTYSAAVFGLPYDNTNRVDFDVLDGTPFRTFIDLDVTAGLQAIVNRPGWASGNDAMILLVDNGTSAGTAGSLFSIGDGYPYYPQLIVDMTPAGPVVPNGAATGATSWSGSAAGAAPVLPTLSGSASGAFAYTGSAAGVSPTVTPALGDGAGGLAFTGSAAGAAPVVPVSTGSATGTFDLTGDAAGAAPVLPDLTGSATGSFDLSGTAAGSVLMDGSASGTTLLAGLAAGVAEHTGSTSGGFGSSGSATGSTATSGATAGAFGFTGSATGGAAPVPPALGTATGSFGLTGSTTGATAHEGASSGGFAASGSATGSALHEGAGSGGFAIAGTSTGSAPALDVQTGSAHGAFTLAGSASGATSARGDGSGAFDLSGTAAGSAPSGGAGAGSWAAVGDAAGASSREGVAGGGFAVTASAAGTAPLVGTESGAGAGTFRFTGTASGERHQSGDAAGSFELSGAALGDAPAVAGVSGSAAGALSWSGDATGTTAPLGTATGVVTVSGSASGSVPAIPIPTGSAGGSFELSGESSGTAANGGSANGSVTWTGEALAGYWGVRSGAATGSWTNYGAAYGRPTYPQVKHTAATINHNLTGASSTPNTTGARVATNGASARVRAVY